MTDFEYLLSVADDERAGRLIAAESADRFRDVLCEILGYEENPGDDRLVEDLRNRHGFTGPEPTRWRRYLSGQLARLDPLDAERLGGENRLPGISVERGDSDQ